MAGLTEPLRELHRLHRHIRELKGEIEGGPRFLQSQQAKVKYAETELKDAQDHLKRLKVTVHEKEVSLKSTHAQIGKYEKQLNEVGSKKEYEALQAEIGHCRATCSTLEDEILLAMSEIEEKSPEIPKLEAALKEAQTQTANFDQHLKERVERLTKELQEATAALAQVDQQIPGEFRQLLDRLTTTHGADGLAAVQDKTCTNCYGAITAQLANELEAGKFSLCKNCGRALYLARR